MNCGASAKLWLSLLLLSPAYGRAVAQQPEPPPAPTEEPESPGIFPRLNLYLPEGRADIRLVKPIRNSLFESQINYNFVSGDISAFLRYKYYGRRGTSTLSFFDAIEFASLERFSNEFSRTRGALYVQRIPLDFYNRLYGLLELDRLTFSNPQRQPDENKTNLYLKLGYQLGTPSDEDLNAVVGEARDRILSLFTARRQIGPRGRGLSFAVTWGFPYLGGDYEYVKTEFEALQAIPISQRHRLTLRLHGGYFPYKKAVRDSFDPTLSTPFSIPRYELFFLNGRERLKGYRGEERGPDEADLTAEYAVPVFTERYHHLWGVEWNSLYAIGYAGAGNVGDDASVYGDLRHYRVDLGLGIEAGAAYRKYRTFVAALVAKTVVNGVGGLRFLVSLKTYR